MKTKIVTTLLLLAIAIPTSAQVIGPVKTIRVRSTTTAEVNVNARGGASTTPERIANAKARSVQEIDRRIAALNRLITRIEAMKKISATAKSNLTAEVKVEITKLADLKVKIEADTDIATLRTDITSITKSYRIYALIMPQISILAAADRINTAADMIVAVVAKLETRIDEAEDDGVNVSGLAAIVANIKAEAESAKVNASAAVTLVTNLEPDNGDRAIAEANNKALREAHAKIKAAHADLQQAHGLAKNVIQRIRETGIKMNAKGDIRATTTVNTTTQ